MCLSVMLTMLTAFWIMAAGWCQLLL